MWRNIGFKAQLLVAWIRFKKVIVRNIELVFHIPSKKRYIVFYHGHDSKELDKLLDECQAKNDRAEARRNKAIINRLETGVFILLCAMFVLVLHFIKEIL